MSCARDSVSADRVSRYVDGKKPLWCVTVCLHSDFVDIHSVQILSPRLCVCVCVCGCYAN